MPGGRPKGYPKSGGRQKGAVDKIKREAILAAQGITPLDYMMMLVRAETPPGLDPAVARARETLRFEARPCSLADNYLGRRSREAPEEGGD
jgi:hypothetical protein